MFVFSPGKLCTSVHNWLYNLSSEDACKTWGTQDGASVGPWHSAIITTTPILTHRARSTYLHIWIPINRSKLPFFSDQFHSYRLLLRQSLSLELPNKTITYSSTPPFVSKIKEPYTPHYIWVLQQCQTSKIKNSKAGNAMPEPVSNASTYGT